MKQSAMKLSVLACAATLFGMISSNPAHSQACQLAAPSIKVHQSGGISTDPNKCVSLLDYSFSVDANSGNKTLYMGLFQGAAPAAVNDASKVPNYTELLNNGNPPVFTINIDNQLATAEFDGGSPLLNSAFVESNRALQQRLFNDTWGVGTPAQDAQIHFQDDASLPAMYITRTDETINGVSFYRFTVYNVRVEWTKDANGNCVTPPTYKAFSYATNSASGVVVHCALDASSVSITPAEVLVRTTCPASPAQPTYQVLYSGSATFSYDVYYDTDGNGNFDAGSDTKITTTSVTGTGPYDSGQVPYGPYGTNQNNLFVIWSSPNPLPTGADPIYYTALQSCAGLALPVHFGNITASVAQGKISVDFQTLTENNNKEFVIEASKDSKNWKEVGRLSSRADNGTTKDTLNYHFSTSLPISLAAVSLALLLLMPMARSRKLRVAIVVAVIAVFAACAKNSGREIDTNGAQKIFIRIAQHDFSGKITYSKVIQATVE